MSSIYIDLCCRFLQLISRRRRIRRKRKQNKIKNSTFRFRIITILFNVAQINEADDARKAEEKSKQN